MICPKPWRGSGARCRRRDRTKDGALRLLPWTFPATLARSMPQGDHAPVDGELLESVMVRVADRIARGEGPPRLRLPRGKDELPKLVCLDYNHWLYLALADDPVRGSKGARAARAALERARDAGSVAIPVSGTNAYEVIARNDPASRERMAKFMVAFSGNYSLVNETEVVKQELASAVRAVYLGEPGVSDIRTELMQWGIDSAIAGKGFEILTDEPAVGALLEQTMREPEMSAAALVHGVRRTSVRAMKVKDQDARDIVDRVRTIDANLTLAARRRLELRNLFTDGALATVLRTIARVRGLDVYEFSQWLLRDDNAVHLALATPGIHVESTLLFQRDRNRDDKTHENDGKDLGFLGMAIPYANIAVLEKRWAQLARSTKLAKKYATRVVGKLDDLPRALDEEGCL